MKTIKSMRQAREACGAADPETKRALARFFARRNLAAAKKAGRPLSEDGYTARLARGEI